MTYVPMKPVTLLCPACGAVADKPCKIRRGELGPVHIERLLFGATKDVEARKKPGKSTHYARRKDRKLKNLLERLSKAEGRTDSIPACRD